MEFQSAVRWTYGNGYKNKEFSFFEWDHDYPIRMMGSGDYGQCISKALYILNKIDVCVADRPFNIPKVQCSGNNYYSLGQVLYCFDLLLNKIIIAIIEILKDERLGSRELTSDKILPDQGIALLNLPFDWLLQ